jgi:hypothetical protein
MNALRPALAALVLAAAPARGPAQVLVPGDPPLTREAVNLYQQMWEWYCDVRLTPGQRLPSPRAATTLAMLETELQRLYPALARLTPR